MTTAKTKPDRNRIPVPTPLVEPAPGEERRLFWCGALDELPSAFCDLAGIGFPKLTELVRRVDSVGRTERIRLRGHVLALTMRQLESLAERLGRTIVRPTPGPTAEPYTGEIRDKGAGNAPWGTIITSPSAEMIKATAHMRRPMRPLEPRRGDRPLAEFIYCVPAESLKPNLWDTELPKPIAETGLEFTGAVAD